ncbi:MAG TPA: radical SAM protein, partial [Steroidobacteraceae bacterium]
GRRLESLRRLPRERVTLQISLDSPTPERHDRHRGRGTWRRAWRGIERARAEGFRVRLAATVSDDIEAREFERFLDAQQIRAEDRVIRRVALRGVATQGLALARVDVVPEITITNEGVYWHPVGADDADMFLTAEIFPLAEAFAALRRALDQETDHRRRLATIFNCA